MAVSRPKGVQPGPSIDVEACPLLSSCPLVVAMLSDPLYDDGARRELATISLFVEAGRLKASLNDRQEQRSLYVTSETLADLLRTLETMLESGTAGWRAWPSRSGKK